MVKNAYTIFKEIKNRKHMTIIRIAKEFKVNYKCAQSAYYLYKNYQLNNSS